MAAQGKCLCGQVTYRLDTEPSFSGVCHCKSCQLQTGSAFSTLVGIPTAALQIQGTLTCYDDTSSESGSGVDRYFCGLCGSPIYSSLRANRDMVYIKSGTLDDSSDFQPQAHFWCDSKQSWVILNDAVPTLARQP